MSLLNSKFDIVSVDNPLAVSALAQVLEVDNPPALGTNGTPQPGTIPPGAIVMMNNSGKAVLASAPDRTTPALPVLPFVTIDGNMDFSGSFVQKLTVFAGGYTMKTDQYTNASFQPGLPVTFAAGKVTLLALADVAKYQIFGFVGPGGLDTVEGVLEVIVPQGAGF